jgi:hypothetical protein
MLHSAISDAIFSTPDIVAIPTFRLPIAVFCD